MEFMYGVQYRGETGKIETALWRASAKTEHCAQNIQLEDALCTVELQVLSPSPLRLRMRVLASGVTRDVKKAILMDADNAEILPGYAACSCRAYSDWDHVWEHAITGCPGDADMRPDAVSAAGLVRNENHRGVALGFQAPVRCAAHFDLGAVRTRAYETVRLPVSPDAPFESDVLMVTPEAHFSLALGMLRAGDAPRRRVSDAREFFGYNTWEAYHDAVTQYDIRRELRAIRDIPLLREHIHYFIIDSGWQIRDGYYTVDETKFPDGMENMAREIREAGFIPGIWTGPLRVPLDEKLTSDHPDWFLHADGELLTNETSKTLGILDITHPEVLAFLKELYARLRGWGYRYFKVDFLKEAAMFSTPGNHNYRENARYYDSTITIEDAMSRLYKIIREAVGEDSFLMACGTHLMADCSVFDASRAGGDISAYWARVPVQAMDVARRFALHGTAFLIDPDFSVLTGERTVTEEGWNHLPTDRPYQFNAYSGPLFSLEEARSWLTFVILSGGLVNLSDRAYALKTEGLELLRVLYAYAGGESALPVDAAERMPCVFARRREGGNLLGIVNWMDEEKRFDIRLSDLPVDIVSGTFLNVWTGETVRAERGALSFLVPPRHSVLLEEIAR